MTSIQKSFLPFILANKSPISLKATMCPKTKTRKTTATKSHLLSFSEAQGMCVTQFLASVVLRKFLGKLWFPWYRHHPLPVCLVSCHINVMVVVEQPSCDHEATMRMKATWSGECSKKPEEISIPNDFVNLLYLLSTIYL